MQTRIRLAKKVLSVGRRIYDRVTIYLSAVGDQKQGPLHQRDYQEDLVIFHMSLYNIC